MGGSIIFLRAALSSLSLGKYGSTIIKYSGMQSMRTTLRPVAAEVAWLDAATFANETTQKGMCIGV